MKSKITIIVVILVIIVGVTAFLNMETVKTNKKLEEEAMFKITENGEEKGILKMNEIRKLGETEFKANLKKSGKDPIEYTYTGVPLKNIFKECVVSLEGKSAVIVKAIDGYTVAVSIEKVLQDDNVYLAYMREGESIGNRENGGKGPYQMIISKDKFSQYWCKFAIEADVQ